MDGKAVRDLIVLMDQVDDPREPNIRHKLGDILVIAVLAVICGANSAVEIELFGRSKRSWLRTFIDLPGGIPSHDTFNRLLALISPESFEAAFTRWLKTLNQDTQDARLIAADGKTIRGSMERANTRSGINMVTAYCVQSGLALAQMGTTGKGKEAPTLKKLLACMDLRGAVVTVDALHCRPKVANQILDQHGDYIMQLKGNNAEMHRAAYRVMTSVMDPDTRFYGYRDHVVVENQGHGRQETRCVWVTDQVDPVTYYPMQRWDGIRTLVLVENHREMLNGQVESERHVYLSSLDKPSAQTMLEHIRGHWGIENGLHWMLDVGFREDECRMRTGHAAENMSRLRRIGLNLLKQDKTTKAGINAKRLRCGWDHDYLLAVLTQKTDEFI